LLAELEGECEEGEFGHETSWAAGAGFEVGPGFVALEVGIVDTVVRAVIGVGESCGGEVGGDVVVSAVVCSGVHVDGGGCEVEETVESLGLGEFLGDTHVSGNAVLHARYDDALNTVSVHVHRHGHDGLVGASHPRWRELGLALEASKLGLHWQSRYYMTRLSFPVSSLLIIITTIMDTSTLMALRSWTTMPCNVCDGRNNPTYSPQGGVFVI
jgi:hypothetical protein